MRNKKPTLSGAVCALLCALLALGGCGAAETADEVLRGRYMERELTLPENLARIIALDRMEDGSLWLLGMEDTGGETLLDYRIWSSPDSGESWRAEQYAWLEGWNTGEDPYAGEYIAHACFRSPELLYIAAVDYGEGTTQEGAGGYARDLPVASLYRADRNTLEVYEGLSLLSGYEMDDDADPVAPYGMALADGGLVLHYFNYAKLLDPETGAELGRFAADSAYSFTAFGDTLAAVQEDRIAVYGLEADIPRELAYTKAVGDDGTYSASAYRTVLAPVEEDGALFYANASGIYRALLDGSLTEKLLDGELVSMGMPAFEIQRLLRCGDGSFLLQCTGANLAGGFQLFRYTFDPDVPSVPGRELRVYALADNETVRYAVGRMQLGDPDVMVNFEVGLRDDSVTAADALRTLSTQLLAGSGPDILVLDGMPVESYIRRGALLDLTGLLDARIASGELLPAVAGTYRRDGALYAVPGRFSVSLLHAVDAGGVTDLESLTAYVEDHENSGSILHMPGNAMVRFYGMLSAGWFLEDGSLNEAQLRRDLENLARLLDPPEVWYDYDIAPSLRSGALLLKRDEIAANVGWLSSLDDINAICAFRELTGTGDLTLFPAGGVFEPGMVLGVNAATAEPELAMRFVELALGPDVLAFDFADGLPVNTEALAEQVANETPLYSTFGSYEEEDPETGVIRHVLMEGQRQPPEIRRLAADLVSAAATAAPTDLVVRQIIEEETMAYFLGESTLDETVAALKGKLDLYLAE